MKEAKKSDSLMVAHARRELEMAGLFTANKENDYDGFIGRGTLALVKLFNDWTDDDPAKMQAIHNVFNAVIFGDLLSPPTNDPDEWETVEVEGQSITRNKRNNMYITRDDRQTWYNLRTEQRGICNDSETGKPLEGVEDPNGPAKEDAKDQESTADADDSGDGKSSELAAADEASTKSEEGEPSVAEPQAGADSGPVEDGELDKGVEPESETGSSEAEAPKNKPQSGKA